MRTHLGYFSYTTREMYGITQTEEDIKDGDLFVCNNGKTVGFLMEAWPTALFGEIGQLHVPNDEGAVAFAAKYPETYARAKSMGEMLELAPATMTTHRIEISVE